MAELRSSLLMACVVAAIALCHSTEATPVPQGYTLMYNYTAPSAQSVVLAAGDVLICGTNPVTAISIATGKLLWTYNLNAAARVAGLATAPCLPDVVFVAAREPDYNGTLAALDVTTGAVHWNESMDMPLVGATCLSTGQPLALLLEAYSFPNQLLTAIDGHTGAVHLQVPQQTTSSSFIQAGADKVVTCGGNQICATQSSSLLTGDYLWGQSTRASDDDFFQMSYAFDSDNNGYFSEARNTFKRDANTGNITAQINVPAEQHGGADVVIGNAGVYLLYSGDLHLYTSDLKHVWSMPNLPYGVVLDDSHATYLLAPPEPDTNQTSVVMYRLSVTTGAVGWNITLQIPAGEQSAGCDMGLHTATATIWCISVARSSSHTSIFEVDLTTGAVLRQGVFAGTEYGLTPATLNAPSGVIPLVNLYSTYVLGVAPVH